MKKITKGIIAFLLVFTLLPSVSANNEMKDRGTFIPNDETGIADTALYEYIKIQSGKNEVFSKDLENITELRLTDKIYSIKTLSGLELMEMPSLKTLELDIQTLTTLEDVVELTQLKELIIKSSSLTALPDDLEKLSNLNKIEIYDSPIEELSESFYELPMLDTIVLSNLPLTSLEAEIKEIPYLESLTLTSMNFEIPEEVYEIPFLRFLTIEKMGVDNVSDQIASLGYLEELSLADNELSEIPANLYEIRTLKKLVLRNNHIKEIDIDVERLVNLVELDISKNELTELPIQIANLNNLSALNIADNQLTCLDSEFGYLKLMNIYDIFKYYDLEKCDYVETPKYIEDTILMVKDNVVMQGGTTNQDVTIMSNNEVYFVVDMVMSQELSNEIVVSGEGFHSVSAVIEELGTVASMTFTIDRQAPNIKIQNNDMESTGFTTDIAIESDEEGIFYVNGIAREEGTMILLSENGDYDVYIEDIAGNKSNTLTFYIEKEEIAVANEVEKKAETSKMWYVVFFIYVVGASIGSYYFLKRGAELEME